MSLFQNKISQEKQQILMYFLLYPHLMWKKCTSIFHIQNLSLIVNKFSLQKIWIQLKTMFPLIKLSHRLVHYQVTVLQIFYLHIALNVRNTWRSTIFLISITFKLNKSYSPPLPNIIGLFYCIILPIQLLSVV